MLLVQNEVPLLLALSPPAACRGRAIHALWKEGDEVDLKKFQRSKDRGWVSLPRRRTTSTSFVVAARAAKFDHVFEAETRIDESCAHVREEEASSRHEKGRYLRENWIDYGANIAGLSN